MFQFLQMAALIAAMRGLGAAGPPTPTAACTVVQVDETHFDVTATWSGFSVSELDFLQGPTFMSQSLLKHGTRRGDVTITFSFLPTAVQLTGPKLGLRQACSLVG